MPLGAVVDRFGSRRSFILGTALTGCVAAFGYVVENHWLLIFLRVAFGSARGLGWIASQTYVTSPGRASDSAKLTGRFSFFSNVGLMAGPLTAGATAELVGFRLAFLSVTVYAFLFSAFGLLLVQTPASGGHGRPATGGVGFRSAVQLLRVGNVKVALILTGIRLWIARTWASFFPLYLVELGVDAGTAGAVIATDGLMATMMAPTAGFWCRFAPPPVVATTGLCLGVLGMVIAPHLATVPIVFVVPVLIGIGTGVSLPLLLSIISDAAPRRRGVALGLRQVAANAASGTAPLVVGPLIAVAGTAMAFAVSGAFAWSLLAVSGLLHALSSRRPPGGGGGTG